MQQLDIIVLALLAAGFVAGAVKGFVKQAVSLVCIIVGIVAGRVVSPLVAGMFDDAYRLPAYGVSFILAFVAVMLAGALVSRALRALLRSADLGWANRLAGGALGAFGCLVLVGLAINLIEIAGAADEVFPAGAAEHSIFYDAAKGSLGRLMPLVETVGDTAGRIIDTASGTTGGEQ